MKPEDVSSMKFETLAIHAGQAPDPSTGAITVPIFQTSTYVQEAPGKHKGYDYSRTRNPTRTALEENLAALEGGRCGLAFASGMAAANAVMNLLKAGDHVIAGNDLYGGTYRLFTKVYAQYGISFTFVDATQPEQVESAFRPNTRLLWIESPTNPLLRVVDLKAMAAIATKRNCLLVVDNTFASPYLQQPLNLGADLVVHSTTKYLGGHCDLVGGAIVLNRADLGERLAFYQNAVGAVPGPLDCWLVLRGTKTLALRMERHCANALAVARYLEGHAKVEKVFYPGLPSHPQHCLAKEQMRDYGGMVSFLIAGGAEGAKRFVSLTKVFSLAESLGGVESLIEHPASMTHGSIPEEERQAAGLADNLVRLSVGIEHIEDLLADLAQALDKV